LAGDSVTDEWQILQALHERKMQLREDLERQLGKAKLQLQKQWVLEQLREKKQREVHSRKWSVYDYEQPWDKDKDVQTRNYSSLQGAKGIEDRFFDRFSYDEDARVRKWRQA